VVSASGGFSQVGHPHAEEEEGGQQPTPPSDLYLPLGIIFC